MEDSNMEHHSLKIVEPNNPDKIITLNEKTLKYILTKDEIKDKSISVISITGAFRQGKSFLLNFLLRYLQIKYVEKKDLTDWLTNGSLQGFPYSPGSSRYTVGIHMWSEIFFARLPSGVEVAIILLDTQGSFDNQTSMDDCAKIFALSTLISSVQIYNVMRTIKQYDLAHLQCFGGYGSLMSSNELAQPEARPFQNLCFLVRDWAFPYEQPYGNDGGAAYLQKIFGSDNCEVKEQVDNIKSLFDKVDCFLLPSPGRIVETSDSSNINLNDIDEDFKKYVQEFVTMLLSPERLILKTVNGTEVKAGELVNYIQNYTNALNDPNLLKVETIFKATVEAQHRNAFSRAFRFYKGNMDIDVTFNSRCFKEDELNRIHDDNKTRTDNYYTKFKKIINEDISKKYIQKLNDETNEEFERYKAMNQEKFYQQKNEWHKFSSKKLQQTMLMDINSRKYESFDHHEFHYLRDKIGYALYGPPEETNGYKYEKKKKIESLLKVIVKENNILAKWKDRVIISYIYVCTEPLPHEKEKETQMNQDYNPKSDLTPELTLIPVFVLRKCKNAENSCRVFIDHIERVYENWEDYLSDNKLPKCEMIYPKNGRYEADSEGNVILEKRLSPACATSNVILETTDLAGVIGSIASGGVLVAATAIPAVAAAPFVVPVAAITGATIGMYSLIRSAFTIHDRRIHRENLNFFQSSEACGAYINIVAGSLGFLGGGMIYNFAVRGVTIAQEAAAAMNTINIAGAGGVFIRFKRIINKINPIKLKLKNEKITKNDMEKYGGVITFLTTPPNKPNPSDTEIQTMSVCINNCFKGISLNSEVLKILAINLVKIFGTTDSTIKHKIINAVSQLASALIEGPKNYMEELDKIFPEHKKYFQLFNMVNSFFQEMVNQAEEKFFKWLRILEKEEYYFIRLLSLDADSRARAIFNIVSQNYFIDGNLTETGLKELLIYFYGWFVLQEDFSKAKLRRRRCRVEHSGTAAQKVNCTVCGGYFYSRN